MAKGLAVWLRGSQFGLFTLALLVGAGSGVGALAFRYLIYGATWLATGQRQFGQSGYVGSSHLPWLGLGFLVVIPVVGGAIYGPLIRRYAPEARGHGVPEVMIAVADNGGRIRPQVSAVKALASAVCIGTGGSVGREGPIVQIGSALASSLGQRVRLPEKKLRVLVACGAAGGIAATFNAPITGVFFGVEVILRAFSVEAIFTVMLSSMVADVISQAALGSAVFFNRFPAGIALHHADDYLLIAVLSVGAALLGVTFKTVLYQVEDLCDRAWKRRPEWARPIAGGVLLGLLLLALPQMYGVGYPVMYKAVDGDYAIWFLVILAFAKMLATSLTIGIGGSGGVFAPSLFVGATAGMAFGLAAHRVFGSGAGPAALYAVVAMGAVFAAAARAPLTSLASVVELTGDFSLALPVMLGVAIASSVSRAASYGTIYTTKLLRRGTDIDRSTPLGGFRDLTVAEAMHPFPEPLPAHPAPLGASDIESEPPGLLTHTRSTPAVVETDSLAHAMGQLVLHGRDGLPVISADGQQLVGWLTNQTVLQNLAAQFNAAEAEAAQAELNADPSLPPASQTGRPPHGYRIGELVIDGTSPAVGRHLQSLTLPAAAIPVSVVRNRVLRAPDTTLTLAPGDQVNFLIPAQGPSPSGPAL